MERNYQVIVIGPRGYKVEANLCRTAEQFKNMKVRQLKEKIWEEFPEYSVGEPGLLFTDKLLYGDDTLLSDYGIQHKSVIYMLIRLPGGGPPPPGSLDNSGMGDKTGKNRSMESLKLSF